VKRVAVAVGALLLLAVLFALSIGLASEGGEEIVALETRAADGEAVVTRLWVVDDGGREWLRAGTPGSGWLARIEANPAVRVTRGDLARDYTAVPVRDPATRDRIHALMREKYGLADRWISLIRDGSGSVPVRLDPADAD
jgi:hypothetical protein